MLHVRFLIKPVCLLAAATISVTAGAQPIEARAICVFGTQPPRPCTLRFTSGPRGATTLIARASGGRTARFVGQRADGWLSGTLDGVRAMGYELNRGHVVFSTATLARSFRYWTAGNEHGSY